MIFRVRDAARIDLAEIWLSTAERWSIGQADDYVRVIEQRFARICDFPESYPVYECQHGIFRKALSGEHLIFYTLNNADVDILRILHNRMDFDEELG